MTLSEGIVKINSRILDSTELKKYDKLEKEGISVCGYTNKDIRVQLNDQLKCLDNRLEVQQGIVNEFQDIFRRKAEIELKYSQELDKLAKTINNRNKEHKQKRDGWQLFSSMQVWEQLVSQTKKSSKDHAALADIYTTHITQRCSNINEDLQRMYRKCREIGYEIHEEVLKVLHELHTAMKTHHNYQSEFRQAESKLQIVEKNREKLQKSVAPEKREKNKKYRLMEKEYQKRRQKYDDARLKATKARNEYLLNMDAANSSIQKYFVDDLSDLIDCMDYGFHQSLYRAVMMHSSGLDQIRRSLQMDNDSLDKTLAGLDSRLDKQRFFESNNATFMIPKKFEYNPVRRDESESLVQKSVMDELEARKQKLKERLATLKVDSEEIWKSMESAEKTLSEMVSATDYDTTRFFIEEDRSAQREPEAIVQKLKADRQEIEDFYTAKFREYVLNSNRMSRLQAKYDNIRVTLGDQTLQAAEGNLTLTRRPNVGRRRRIGKASRGHHGGGQPKLFGGSLEEYLEEINQDIPTILKSCVRVINLYGLHHHGIFRVNGQQIEINNMRDAFERGDDPLADTTDASDINSVAGVLKLYFRELREPMFSLQYFDHLMDLSQLESKHEFVVKVRDLVKTWPRPIFIVMRYLFAFLNHLSEFSDENMMDPYNLAICFGPTLVPIPEDRDQVQFQNLVNELIKNFIIFHEDIFPPSVPGTVYEKYLTMEPDDMGDSPNVDQSQDDLLDNDSELTEDDSVFKEENEREDRDFSLDLFGKSEAMEAQALYDFNARSAREVNFHKGDTLVLFKQVSNDWWKGSVRGQEGLIPDKYIMLKMRGEDDRERLESFKSSDHEPRDRLGSYEEDKRSRASSSSDKMSTSQPSPSPSYRRRANSTQTSSTSPKSPTRESRSSVTSSTRSSTSTKPTSPISTVITVNNPESSIASAGSGGGGRRKSKESIRDVPASPPAISSTTASTVSKLDSPKEEDEANLGSSKSRTKTPSPHSHIIKVSGPVTNLDETVTSGETTSVSGGVTEAMAPRSRLPLSPSMEARLSNSQDSLNSTGSNQELKTQLDSTLAEVEAIAEHLEKQKKNPLEKSISDAVVIPSSSKPKISPDLPKPTVRRKTSDQTTVSSSSSNSKTLPSNGARPRERGVSLASMTSAAPNPVPRSTVTSASASDVSSTASAGQPPSVMLKQSSWASREQIHNTNGDNGEPKAFVRNKSLWERSAARTASTQSYLGPTAQQEAGSLRGGFRSNRDFWNQRVAIQQKQKHTPDLVMDLPASEASTNKPKPRPRVHGKNSTDSMSSSNSSGSGSGDENNSLAADQFANTNQNTLTRKSSKTPSENDNNGGNGNSPPPASAVVNVPKKIPPVQARLQRKSPPRE